MNYAADAATSNPFGYVIGGLTGAFKGRFATLPFYYKVREYNDSESRDLWEYELNLDQEERGRLVAHAWELSTTHFNYFYLSENCSYHMLSLLEAAAPRLNLTRGLSWYVIPADTLKVILKVPNLVKTKFFRPSIQTQFRRRVGQLTRHQRKTLGAWIRAPRNSNPTVNASLKQISIVDSFLDYIDLHHSDELRKNDPVITSWREDVLQSRLQLPAARATSSADSDVEPPEKGHGSSRARAGYHRSSILGSSLEFEQRFAFHDFLDPFAGFPKTAQIVFFNFIGRFQDGGSFPIIQEVTMLNVAVRNPITEFEKKASWGITIEGKKIVDERCLNCFMGRVAGEYGYTFQTPGVPQLWVYSLLNGSVEASSAFTDIVDIVAAPVLGATVRIHSGLNANIEAVYRRGLLDSFEDRQLTLGVRRGSTKVFADIGLRFSNEDQEGSMSIGFYY